MFKAEVLIMHSYSLSIELSYEKRVVNRTSVIALNTLLAIEA